VNGGIVAEPRTFVTAPAAQHFKSEADSGMSWVGRSVDVARLPELLSLADDVGASKEPCLLRRGDQPVAILVPLELGPDVSVFLPPTADDIEAFRAAAGGWKDLDGVDEMARYIKSLRERPDEPFDEE
jgi:hypothetical protein